MAKELSPAELAAALIAMGLPVPEELNEKVANSVEDAAVSAIADRLSVEDENSEIAEKWQANLFDLAEQFHGEFKAETNNVGRGKRIDRKVQIETPMGTLFVRLSKTV